MLSSFLFTVIRTHKKCEIFCVRKPQMSQSTTHPVLARCMNIQLSTLSAVTSSLSKVSKIMSSILLLVSMAMCFRLLSHVVVNCAK